MASLPKRRFLMQMTADEASAAHIVRCIRR
jgi:hypothetical protein